MSSQMEILSNKFNTLLTQYQNTYQDFVNTIGSNDNSFTLVDNSVFIGGNNINTIQNSSINNCLTSCTSTQSCSGATFDNNQNTCTLSSGNGNIINSKNQTAIVKQALYYSHQLQKINDELTNINALMMNLANSSDDSYKQSEQMNNKKAEILQQNYNTLEEERYQIEQIIRQYETLNSAYENGSINVTSNYYSYIMYLFIAIFLVFLLFKFSLTSEQRGGGNMKISPFIFGILAFIIVFNAVLKN
jgi:lipopolysaccharide export LptBFGC system permease protein LptF